MPIIYIHLNIIAMRYLISLIENLENWSYAVTDNNPNFKFVFKNKETETEIVLEVGVEGKYLEVYGIYTNNIGKSPLFSTGLKNINSYYQKGARIGASSVKFIAREVMTHIRKLFPNVTTISGERFTGATYGKPLRYRNKEIEYKR